MSLRNIVLRIHETPHRAVLAITGGGAEAIGELLRYGSGSNTLLEAVVPYDQQAFRDFVKGTPEKYCSADAASDLAASAYIRARQLHPNGPVVGVGATSSLTKDGERIGRKHNAYIAVQNDDSTYACEVLLSDCQRTRTEQEARVSQAIIGCLAMMCGIPANQNCMSGNLISEGVHYGVGQEMVEVCKGQRDITPSMVNRENRVIFSGAFNPFHEMHEKIASKVAELTGRRIDLEICVKNVDKPALSHATIHSRRDHAVEAMYQKQWAGELFFTNTATFKQKALAFPKATFIIGWDTYVRLNDPKYGDLEEAASIFKNTGAKFLVFHRIINGVSSVDAPNVPLRMAEFSKIISPEDFPPVDMSSTQIRQATEQKC